MDSGQTKPETCVRVAVGLRHAAGSGKQERFRFVSEDSSRLIFADKTDKGIQEGCFTFDGIFSLDTGQAEVFSELVRPLLAMVPLGYSVSLLLWEACRSQTKPQCQGLGQHCSIVQQVIETIFQDPEPPGDSADCLRTVSFVQLCADGNTRDLLRPWTRALQVMDVHPLGLMVEEASEIVVSNSKAACSVYVSGLEHSLAQSQGCLPQSQAEQHAATCASLFTLTLEQELEASKRQRSAIRILEFPGGAKPGLEPYVGLSPLLQAVSPAELPHNARFLPWILKRMLEGNNLTFLLLCLTLPDASGEEILSALSLAEQVRRLPKKVSPLQWDPTEAVWRRRMEIQALRAQLFSSSSLVAQESVIKGLRRALRELQVLKKQRQEKRRETAETFERDGSCHPEAKRGTLLQSGGEEQLSNQVQTDTQRSPEFLDRVIPKLGEDITGFVSLSNDKEGEAAKSSPRPFGPGNEAETEAKPLQRAASRPKEQTCTASVTGTVESWASEQHLALELQFALAKARRQHLREQHQSLIQQALLKLEEERVGNQELPATQREMQCWPKEKAVLTMQLEALRKEQAEAEKDLETLYQQHRLEAEARKRHVLQVFQAYRGLSEAQTDALERRYRKLLQEALQDAISLAAQNQQLWTQRRVGCTDQAVQTDPQAPTTSYAVPEQQPRPLSKSTVPLP